MKIIDACLWLQDRNMVIGTWGNISIRIGETILLTPSRIPYSELKPEDLVTIDMEGNIIDGIHLPTSEKEVHRMIYLQRPDIGSVVHCHSECACAVASAGISIPPLIEEMSQLLGGKVSCTRNYIPAGRHEELGREAAAAIGKSYAVLLRNHGPVCCGKDLDEALLTSLVLEKAAKMYLMLKGKLRYKPIQDAFVDEERRRYLYTYGKE